MTSSKVLCLRGALRSSAGELRRARTFRQVSEGVEGQSFANGQSSTKEAQR